MVTFEKCFSNYVFAIHITKKPPKNKYLGWFRQFNFLCHPRVNLQLTQIQEWASPDDDDERILIPKIIEVINHEILHFAINDAQEHELYLTEEEQVEPRDNKPEEELVQKLNKELDDNAERALEEYG